MFLLLWISFWDLDWDKPLTSSGENTHFFYIIFNKNWSWFVVWMHILKTFNGSRVNTIYAVYKKQLLFFTFFILTEKAFNFWSSSSFLKLMKKNFIWWLNYFFVYKVTFITFLSFSLDKTGLISYRKNKSALLTCYWLL